MDDGVSTSPAPGHNRRGGAGPEGPPDRIEKISVGDVLRDDSPEPPLWTTVELGDGERWKRVPAENDWCWGPQPLWEPVWSWEYVTFDGPVTVVMAAPSRCSHCGFLVAQKAGGLACKSGKPCPFYGQTIEYLAPPTSRPMPWDTEG